MTIELETPPSLKLTVNSGKKKLWEDDLQQLVSMAHMRMTSLDHNFDDFTIMTMRFK